MFALRRPLCSSLLILPLRRYPAPLHLLHRHLKFFLLLPTRFRTKRCLPLPHFPEPPRCSAAPMRGALRPTSPFTPLRPLQNIDPETGFKSKRMQASRHAPLSLLFSLFLEPSIPHVLFFSDRKPLQVIFQKPLDPCEAPLQLPHPSLDAASRKHQRENIENVSRPMHFGAKTRPCPRQSFVRS